MKYKDLKYNYRECKNSCMVQHTFVKDRRTGQNQYVINMTSDPFYPGLTKPNEVGEILPLYPLELPCWSCPTSTPKQIKVALFLFVSCSFLANNLTFMVKLIDKAIIINVKESRIREKGFIQAIKKV